MNSNDLIEIVRDYVKDKVAPYLWSDAEILRHLRKAERLMCERTHVLVDPNITFDTVASTVSYTIDSNVLRVYAVRVLANDYPLGRLRGRSTKLYMQATEGEPTVFSSEMSDRNILLYPVPDDVYTMQAICAIHPSAPIGPTTDSELPAEHQEELANYAAYRCLITNDVDGERVGTAGEFQELWETYLRDLKREIYRYRTGDMLVLQNWTGARNGGSSNTSVGT